MSPNMILLYVSDPQASALFYGRLFGTEPVELSPGFALFALPSGLMLGLWKKDAVEPRASQMGGGAEIVLRAESPKAVEEIHAGWAKLDVTILDRPVTRDFGFTFVATDPDHHRIRVFHPEG